MTRLGITGHQDRDGLDWTFAADEIRQTLQKAGRPIEGLSSLAVGVDQLFARLILEVGGALTAVIPAHDYETTFEDADRRAYRELLKCARPIELPPAIGGERAFFNAGRWIVDHCDQMIAVWDGAPSHGLGGTADVVAYALSRERPCLHIDPFERTVRHL